jgi:hypothetical protein
MQGHSRGQEDGRYNNNSNNNNNNQGKGQILMSKSLPAPQLQGMLYQQQSPQLPNSRTYSPSEFDNYMGHDQYFHDVDNNAAKKFPKTVSFDATKASCAESSASAGESAAELEILKAIIAREGYLKRLVDISRTVTKKVKPELPDMIDFVRAASLDVVDSILKWRQIKVPRKQSRRGLAAIVNLYLMYIQKDDDAVFMWNGCNYLLKMSTDLDFLADYRAIRRWMGFTLTRNPFCVPCPLEEGTDIFSGMIFMWQYSVDIDKEFIPPVYLFQIQKLWILNS